MVTERGYLKTYGLLLDSSKAKQQSAPITPVRYHTSRLDLQVCGTATTGCENILAGGSIAKLGTRLPLLPPLEKTGRRGIIAPN